MPPHAGSRLPCFPSRHLLPRYAPRADRRLSLAFIAPAISTTAAPAGGTRTRNSPTCCQDHPPRRPDQTSSRPLHPHSVAHAAALVCNATREC
eukprot:363013-Chlamydomonas_euryale.AAC.6